MATTLRTELTRAGCNVGTATIVLQPGIGQPNTIGSSSIAQPKSGAVVPSNDARLDAKFIHRQDQSAPRCIATDATSIYVWVALPSQSPGFMKIPTASSAYTGGSAAPIPVIADF